MNNISSKIASLMGVAADEVKNIVWQNEKVVVFINEPGKYNSVKDIEAYKRAGYTVRIWDENNWNS